MRIREVFKKTHRHFNKKMFMSLLMLLFISITYAQEHLVQGLITDEANSSNCRGNHFN